METIAATLKRAEVESYYATGDDTLLNRYPVQYILNGQAPAGWHSVYQSGEVIIYGR
jgi:hypothetical protein